MNQSFASAEYIDEIWATFEEFRVIVHLIGW